jgi:transcriptional regulator with XRE-family HTH domain
MDNKAGQVDPFDAALAAAIRGKMAERNLTRRAIADRTGIPLVTLERYIKGTRSIPMSKFISIAGAIGVEAGQVIQAAVNILETAGQKNGV